MSIVANTVFAISEVQWSESKQPLAIGYGLIVLDSSVESTYTVIIYAEDGGDELYTFEVTGTTVMIDLYQYETVGKVEIISTSDASVSFYKSI